MERQIDDDTLILMQLRLECIGVAPAGRLTRIPGPDPDDLGRVYAYRASGGIRFYLRDDLPEDVVRALTTLGAERVFHDPSAVAACLPQPGAVDRWHTFRFVTPPDPARYPDAVRLTPDHAGLMRAYHPDMALGSNPAYGATVTVEGRPALVAACISVRENDEAGECYVYTVPEARRKGYGRQAVAAWGAGMLARGKMPFYSHHATNTASAAVARSLGLAFAFEGTVYG